MHCCISFNCSGYLKEWLLDWFQYFNLFSVMFLQLCWNLLTLRLILNSQVAIKFCVLCSPWCAWFVLDADRAVPEGWAYYPRPPEGGGIIRHLYSLCCSRAQQQTSAGNSGITAHSHIELQYYWAILVILIFQHFIIKQLFLYCVFI